jgi:hypothetical protein
MQHEITGPGPLLDASGRLARRGYSKRPVLTYNPENIRVTGVRPLDRLRLKEWDYYGTTTKEFFFAASVANVGYIGLAFAYLIDFEAKTQIERTVVTPLGLFCRLPRTSESGDVDFRLGGIRFHFRREAERRVLSVRWPRFAKGKDLAADLIAHQPRDLDSMVIATPMDGGCFYYNHKVNCLATEGEVRLGDRLRVVHTDRAATTLDWGRGVWPYRTFWNWGSASGYLPDGRPIGLNLGAGFGDLSAATENAVYVGGRMTKLAGVTFDYDAKRFMAPWRFASDDGRLALTLTPFFERTTKMNLGLLSTEVHQMFGTYAGTATTDAGETIAVRDLVGWAEEHVGRW